MAPRKLFRVKVDPNLCVGSGMCVASHPEMFAMQADGHARCTSPAPDEVAAREAEELCPVSAIRLIYEE